MIELTVNGRRVTLEAETGLLDYLAGLGTEPRTVAVEINGRILERDEFPATVLRAGDQVEIVRMVGGGAIWPAESRSRARGVPPRPRSARSTAGCPSR